METYIAKDRRNSQRVKAQIPALAEYAGRRIPLQSVNISRDGMFFLSADFIPPPAVFLANLWLSGEQEPLRAYLTSRFIERTWASYGIGVCISGIATADKAQWEAFYQGCVEAQAELPHRREPAAPPTRKQRVVVVDGALNSLTLQALRQPELEICQAASTREAIVLVREQPADAVISNLRSPGVDGLDLCRGITSRRIQTPIVLLSDGVMPSDFLLGIHSGAALVIGKKCSPQVMAARILQLEPPRASRPVATNAAPESVRNPKRSQLSFLPALS